MIGEIDLTESKRQYEAAYASHYERGNLKSALELYLKILASHSEEPEASYSRTQIQNIVNKVVPSQELLNQNVSLALAKLEVT